MNSALRAILSSILMASALLFASLSNAAPPLPGAIFTTDADGVIINGNTKYGSKCGLTGVWLDGGPGPNAPPTAAGLPDGDYYFQVTGPSGKDLLSNDPVVDRCVTVKGGVITASCGMHNTRPSADAGNGVVVELCGPIMPFDDTPNPGGVYKAWMTPVDDYVGDPTNVDNKCGNGCFHGFVPAASKTDNFKVADTRTFCVKTHKDVLDKKNDTVPGVGWVIMLTDSIGVTNSVFTDANGNAEFCGLLTGFYTVGEVLQSGFELLDTEVEGRSVGPENPTVIQIKNNDRDDEVRVNFLNTECGKSCPK